MILEINKVYNENCLDTMKRMPDNFIDLTLTSPPYDNLRTYNNEIDKSWNEEIWKPIIKELYRITKDGCTIVWIVGDATINGSETGTSFKQALYFMECGFNLHDTMIWYRVDQYPKDNRYNQSFQYMFILTKNKINTFNKFVKMEKSDNSLWDAKKTQRNKNGERKNLSNESISRILKSNSKKFKHSDNIWNIPVGYMISNNEKISYNHPALFPDKLAYYHIMSWSNKNDLVYDPFMGSGTTAKMSIATKRNYIGSEISEEYCKIIEKRILSVQQNLF
jgi:site-specific DNA-methyltransferase (adenine-specific)